MISRRRLIPRRWSVVRKILNGTGSRIMLNGWIRLGQWCNRVIGRWSCRSILVWTTGSSPFYCHPDTDDGCQCGHAADDYADKLGSAQLVFSKVLASLMLTGGLTRYELPDDWLEVTPESEPDPDPDPEPVLDDPPPFPAPDVVPDVPVLVPVPVAWGFDAAVVVCGLVPPPLGGFGLSVTLKPWHTSTWISRTATGVSMVSIHTGMEEATRKSGTRDPQAYPRPHSNCKQLT